MLISTFAFRNVIRHGRRNLTILALVAAGTTLLVAGDAILATADQGIKTSFVDGFTADYSIRSQSEDSFSLFGNEVPLVGEYEVTPRLEDYDKVQSLLKNSKGLSSAVPIVSGLARLDCSSWSGSVIFFGIQPSQYFPAFSSLKIVKGQSFADGAKGILLNQRQYSRITKSLGHELALGESLGLTVFNDSGFTIRSVPFSGIFAYASPSEATDRICLLDLDTARSLDGYLAVKPASSASTADQPIVDGSVDDLFASSQAVVASSGSVNLTSVEKQLSEGPSRQEATQTLTDGYNFVLIKADKGKSGTLAATLEKNIRKEGIQAKLLDWRGSAGGQAQMIFVLRLIFIIGLAILSFAALVIIMNSLVITVLERSGEIGMMRAIGASRSYVSRLFLMETLIVTTSGALLGTLVGALVVSVLAKTGIHLDNPLLVSLFGSDRLRPSLDLLQSVLYFLAATSVGAISWIYPVTLVLKSQPALAMAKASE